ncbi:hypothetical protein WKW79_14555 [Variovorax robiniae]|uniref:Uncharacterized protein n=1 Tax=Variovorax robiniae TaxID=1836199 RepID=A0ABU8X846_9BURK
MANTIVATKAKKPSHSMAEKSTYRAFEDPLIILVHAGDTCHSVGYWDEERIGAYQSDYGPTHLVIGRLAGDDQIQRAAARYGLNMADLRAFRNGITSAPTDIVARFLPQEGAVFEVIRSAGRCRLWKSTTEPHRLADGALCSGRVHYHITVDDEAVVVLMPDLDRHALPNFEHIARQQEANHG